MIGVLLLGIVIGLTWYLFLTPKTYWEKKGVKQTKPWTIFGDLWYLVLRKRTFIDIIQEIYYKFPGSRYNGFYYEFGAPTLLLKDPDLIKQITVKDFDHFTDHRSVMDPEIDPLISGMLFLLKGQTWREMRATLSGAFTSSKMKNMFHLMDEAAGNFIKFFLDKNEDVIELEMKDAYTRYTNDVIASAAFGIQCNSLAQPNNDFYLMGKNVTNFNSVSVMIKSIFIVFMPTVAKLVKLNIFGKSAATFFKKIITETIQIRQEKEIVRPDMINLLMEARKGIKQEDNEIIETGYATVKESSYNGKVKKIKNLTDDLITSQALIFFVAGFDTISTAMCFGSYELARNQDIQARLREEIKETHKNCNGKLTYEVLSKMKYLDMVVSEILRIWPPASAVDRRCTKPYTIEPVSSDERPVHLKLNDIVLLPIYCLHRDPANYPNPDKFDPERFSDENKDSIKPYTYIPFGSGPRNCIGSRFALLEVKALLFNLLLNFEIVPSKKTQIPIKLEKKGRQPAAEGGFWLSLKRVKN